METQKLDWSKLGEMKPYAPTGPGRYVMRCGGVIGLWLTKSNMWGTDSLHYDSGYSHYPDGRFLAGEVSPFDIVAPAPDVLPWEECDQLQDLLEHARNDYASLIEACEADRQARLNLVEECERLKEARDQYKTEMIKVKELNDKWSLTYDAMEAERDNWKQYAEGLKQAIERPRSEVSTLTELHQKQIVDLQDRVSKLEEFHKSPANPYTTIPQEIGSLPAVTDEANPAFKVGDVVVTLDNVNIYKVASVYGNEIYKDEKNWCGSWYLRYATPAERAAFFAANPTLHPAYKPEHGDMKGMEYCEQSKAEYYFSLTYRKWKSYEVLLYDDPRIPGAFARRVQAEKEVV